MNAAARSTMATALNLMARTELARLWTRQPPLTALNSRSLGSAPNDAPLQPERATRAPVR